MNEDTNKIVESKDNNQNGHEAKESSILDLDPLYEIVKSSSKLESSKEKLDLYNDLLKKIPIELYRAKNYLGNHLARRFIKLDFNDQCELLKSVLSNMEFFTNKQLSKFVQNIGNVVLYLKTHALNEEQQFIQILESYRTEFLSELDKNHRLIENSVLDIKKKYSEDIRLYIHQLINKSQYLMDIGIISKGINQFNKEEMEEFVDISRNQILPNIIFLYTETELALIYKNFKKILNKFRRLGRFDMLKYLEIRGSAVYKLQVKEARIKKLKNCILCKTNPILEPHRPLCEKCYNEKLKDFPQKYYDQDNFFIEFCNLFDSFYKEYNKDNGFITIEIDLPFKSEFTVMDVEATGDIFKEKNHFLITMGYLHGSKAFIHQLIDFDKQQEFHKHCRKIARQLPLPAVAYNFVGSERRWLKLYSGGWIDIEQKDILFSENKKLMAHSLRLNNVSFKWNDITGKDCPQESLLYKETGDLIHLKRMAYHNFIDLLKEYQIGLTDVEVLDYLEGKEYDYITHQLKGKFKCKVCRKPFSSELGLKDHMNSAHKGYKKGRSRKKN